MPLPLESYWISRPQEAVFAEWRADRRPLYWGIRGPGGGGKTSLLQRFFRQAVDDGLPAVLLDPGRDRGPPRIGGVDLLLEAEVEGAPTFIAARARLREAADGVRALLARHGSSFGDAWSALQMVAAGGDEALGLVFGTARDAAKVVAKLFSQREEARQRAEAAAPEETLWRALRDDLEAAGGGVLLIDTWERARALEVQTRLVFRHDGDLRTAVEPGPLAMGAVVDGLARFFLDQPLLLLRAGREVPERPYGLPAALVRPRSETVPFSAAEVEEALRSHAPGLPAPPGARVAQMLEVSRGNPLLVERLCYALAMESRAGGWDWAALDATLARFRRDDREGLLGYLTERIVQGLDPGDTVFWRVAVPRRLHRAMAPMLFDGAAEGPSPAARLAGYEQVGLVFRRVEPEVYRLHDEVRDALVLWSRREGTWRAPETAARHRRLADWWDAQAGWTAARAAEVAAAGVSKVAVERPAAQAALEAAYHRVMGDDGFEARCPGRDREGFWDALGGSLSLDELQKRLIAGQVAQISAAQVEALTEVFAEEIRKFTALFDPGVVTRLRSMAHAGSLPADWDEDVELIDELAREHPSSAGLSGQAALLYAESGDTDAAEALYRRALDADPRHAHILGNFAVFMQRVRGGMDAAEALYRRALDADPRHAHILGNFAAFMQNVRGDMDAAEALYRRALDADPRHAHTLGNFALFMQSVRGDMDAAEALYRRALDADPRHANNLGNFALFMQSVRGDMDAAEALYRRALDADPRHANTLGNFALFMESVRGDMDAAEALYRRALDADPRHARTLGNFAIFMQRVRGDMDAAEALYRRALDADPRLARNLGNFALFKQSVRGDMDAAEALYRRALDADPRHTHTLGSFASFLDLVRRRDDEAEGLYRRSVEADPGDANLRLNFAGFLLRRGRRDEGEAMLAAAEPALTRGAEHVERWFYRCVYRLGDPAAARAALRARLAAGDRSPGFDLGRHAEQAEAAGRADAAWVAWAAGVIAGARAVEEEPAAEEAEGGR